MCCFEIQGFLRLLISEFVNGGSDCKTNETARNYYKRQPPQ
jgi:hypothetical protein